MGNFVLFSRGRLIGRRLGAKEEGYDVDCSRVRECGRIGVFFRVKLYRAGVSLNENEIVKYQMRLGNGIIGLC